MRKENPEVISVVEIARGYILMARGLSKKRQFGKALEWLKLASEELRKFPLYKIRKVDDGTTSYRLRALRKAIKEKLKEKELKKEKMVFSA